MEEKKSKAASRDFTDTMNQINELVAATLQKYHPKTVVVCGSSRYADAIAVVKWCFEKKGVAASGLHYLPKWYVDGMKWSSNSHGGEEEDCVEELTAIHLNRILDTDVVVVFNPNGYIGKSTSHEISFAVEHEKPVVKLSESATFDGVFNIVNEMINQ